MFTYVSQRNYKIAIAQGSIIKFKHYINFMPTAIHILTIFVISSLLTEENLRILLQGLIYTTLKARIIDVLQNFQQGKSLEKMKMEMEKRNEKGRRKCKIFCLIFPLQEALQRKKSIKSKKFVDFGINCIIVHLTTYNHSIKSKTFQFDQISPSFLKFSSPILS